MCPKLEPRSDLYFNQMLVMIQPRSGIRGMKVFRRETTGGCHGLVDRRARYSSARRANVVSRGWVVSSRERDPPDTVQGRGARDIAGGGDVFVAHLF
jgi:hypothetical protein